MTEKNTSRQKTTAGRRSRLRRCVYIVLAVLSSLVVLLAALILYIGTESGLRQFTVFLDKVTGGSVHIAGVEGQLWRDVSASGIRIETSSLKISIDSVDLSWQASRLFSGALIVNRLALGPMRIDTKPAPPQPQAATQAPAKLTLPVRVDMPDITLARLAMNSDEATVTDVAIAFKSDRVKHALTLKRATLAQGSLQGEASVSGLAPFAVQARLNAVGSVAGKPLEAVINAQGSLRELYILGEVENPLINADVDILLDVFAPYRYGMLRHGKIALEGFNPQLFDRAAPQADISLHADVRPVGLNQATGIVRIENRVAKSIDLQGIPLKSLDIEWQVSANHLQIDGFNARFGASSQLTGSGMLQPEVFNLEAVAHKLDLQDFFAKQVHSALEGNIALAGPYETPGLKVNLQDKARSLGLIVDTDWRSSAQEQTLLLRQFLLTHHQGEFSATGEIGLYNKRPFKLNARMSGFNPASLGAYPAGNLNATVDIAGFLPPDLQLKLDYTFGPSQFNGAALSGKGQVSLLDKRLERINATLQLGNNHLQAQGGFGGAGDSLNIELALADLRQLGPDFAGRLQGNINLAGTYDALTVRTRLQAQDLHLPGGVSTHTLNIDGNIEPDLRRPLRLIIQGEAIRVSRLNLATLNLQVNGTRAQHSAQLEAQGKWDESVVFIQTVLNGSLPKITAWQGSIERLYAGFADGVVNLQAPARLQVNSEDIVLGRTVLASKHSNITIEEFAVTKGDINTRGELTRLDMADILAWLPDETVESNLVLNGSWQLAIGNSVNGRIELKRREGDVIWRSRSAGSKPAALKLSDFSLNAIINNARVNAEAKAVAQGGDIRATMMTVLSRQNGSWGVYNTSPLDIRVQGNIPHLEALSAWIKPNLQLGGHLNLDVSRRGSVGRATLAGTVQGSALSVYDSDMGLTLTEGVINAHLTPEHLTLEQLSFKGGNGTLHAQGRMGLNDRNASIKIQANRLTAISRPDMLIVLSGQSDMFMQNGELTIHGKANIDEARIQLTRDGAPELSDDVVIVGRTKPREVTTENFTLAALQMDVDLGHSFTFSGKGLEATLGGKIQLAARARQSLYATGMVRIDKGSYRAYGQNLTIEHGFIAFQGPLENPGLDILAIRKGPEVEAGVSISGTALRPQVQLVSTPSVPDNEKLSWMMFGKGSESLDKQDGAAVLMAASALLTGRDGRGIEQQIAQTVGLDEVSLSSGTTTQTAATTYLTLGKRLADNLYLSYEQSLGDVDRALKLQYILSRRWRAVVRAGSQETTFDLFYTISFDHLFKRRD